MALESPASAQYEVIALVILADRRQNADYVYKHQIVLRCVEGNAILKRVSY